MLLDDLWKSEQGSLSNVLCRFQRTWLKGRKCNEKHMFYDIPEFSRRFFCYFIMKDEDFEDDYGKSLNAGAIRYSTGKNPPSVVTPLFGRGLRRQILTDKGIGSWARKVKCGKSRQV